MIQLPQEQFQRDDSGYSTESRIGWIGSKLAQSTGIDVERMNTVHDRIWMRILQGNPANADPADEADQLAEKIVGVATLAEKAAADGGPQAAMVAVMRASGDSIDPLLAQNFLRLASSPIFWMAMDSAGDTSAR
jgi:hypothetical protein